MQDGWGMQTLMQNQQKDDGDIRNNRNIHAYTVAEAFTVAGMRPVDGFKKVMHQRVFEHSFLAIFSIP